MKLISVICVCSHQVAKIKIYFLETHRLRKINVWLPGEGTVRLGRSRTHCCISNGSPTRTYCTKVTWNPSMLCASPDGRGILRGMDTCVRMAESLHCSPELPHIVNQLCPKTK